MKKYIWLILGTVAAFAGVFGFRAWFYPEPTAVRTQILESMPIQRLVMCSGRVETGDTDRLYVEIPCVADTVYVSEGTAVKKGDVLFTVDKEATVQTLASAGNGLNINADDITIDTTITAPISGVIETLNVEEGAAVSVSKPCVVISSSEALQVTVEIGERDIRNICVGQPARISGAAFTKEVYNGTVKSIASSAKQQYSSTTAAETVVEAVVEIDPADLDDSLRLGLTATTDIVIDEQAQGLVVPYDAVMQDDDDREYVYVLENGRAIKRIIETGWELRDGFQVVSGLSAGETIITEPAMITADGMSVYAR